MPLVLKNRVQETTTTIGTGAVVLGGAATGYQVFSSVMSDGDTTYYQITDGTDWELGLGTYNAGANTLVRTTVYESSNSNNAVNFQAGTKDVFIVFPAQQVSGTIVYATIDDLPLSNVVAGAQAYVSSTNRLYLHNGTGWYNIALVNQTPTVTGNSASYTLATDGTPTVVTLTGTDPEGIPLVWSHVATGLDNEATITNVDNVFTITPSTNTADQGTFSVTFRASDGVNIGTAASSFSLIFITPYWDNVSLSVGTNDTSGISNSSYVDRSTNAAAMVAFGTPTQHAFNPYLENWSVNFDGSGDYLQTPAVVPEIADFTIECWIRPSNVTAGLNGTQGIFGQYTTNTSGAFLFYMINGVLRAFTATDTILSNVTFQNNIWYHIALVRSGTTDTLYVDGVAVDSGYLGNILQTNALIGFYIVESRDYYFRGNISNLRVVNSAVYTSNFEPSTQNLTAITGTSLLTCKSNRFIDNSTNAHAITVNGDPQISQFNPFGQGTEYSSGENKGSSLHPASSTSYITTSYSTTNYDWWTEDCTIEAWVYPTSLTGWSYIESSVNPPTLVGNAAVGSTTNYWSFGIDANGAGKFYYFSGSTNQVTSTETVRVNQWNHIAMIKNSSGIKIFVNGVGNNYTAINGTPQSNTGTEFTIGRINNTNIQGYVSDLKLSKGTAIYTSDFTPPSIPVTNTNATLYLPMDNAGVFDRSANENVELLGSTVTSNTQTKYAATSIHKTVANDYIRIANTNNQFDIPANTDFTIEFWLYPLANTAGGNVLATLGWPNYGGWLIYTTGIAYQFYASSNLGDWNVANAQDMGWTYWTNEWKHCAIVRSGSSIKFYLNGVNTGATVTSSLRLYGDSTTPLTIGANKTGGNPHQPFYIEDFQYLVGVAKYTANFTPPTAEQGRIYQAES